ncbi:hypothetical protein DTO96_100900 [Ephemeroptericola cinctiostellae]|uniref:Uncharacterized protein n=1 Tax=Ephemeroptericola cinctiostellae TaxID=2268024 RepID=A0A345D9Y7_9BURK|nr:hypothetical protein DTO96_100900 [Ephemeroptericola cinctiostellae]
MQLGAIYNNKKQACRLVRCCWDAHKRQPHYLLFTVKFANDSLFSLVS